MGESERFAIIIELYIDVKHKYKIINNKKEEFLKQVSGKV